MWKVVLVGWKKRGRVGWSYSEGEGEGEGWY